MMGGLGAGDGRVYTTIDNHQIPQFVPASMGPYEALVNFFDSNLQTFPPPGAQERTVGSYRPPPQVDDTFSGPSLANLADETEQSGWVRRFIVGTYKPYFDVDTSDVVERIMDSLLPFNGGFSGKTSDNPDLYGPFWICTTLIFVAEAIGAFRTYLAHTFNKKEWDYDINLVTWYAGLFYGYVTIVPLILYLILKYFSAPSGLVQLFCFSCLSYCLSYCFSCFSCFFVSI